MDDSWLDLQNRVKAYQKELRELGIRDYQVPGLDREQEEFPQIQEIEGDQILGVIRLPYQIVHLLVVLALAAFPTLFLNLPVGVLAGIYAERRREKALAKSKVKIRGFDVMLTEKVVFCIVAIPSLWCVYGLLLYFFTDFDGPTLFLCILSMPICAYVGVIVSEAGMVDIKDLRPYYMRLFPSSRRRLRKLPETRKQLQIDMRAFIRKVGPSLGEVYFGKELNWNKIQHNYRKSMTGLQRIDSKDADEVTRAARLLVTEEGDEAAEEADDTKNEKNKKDN